MPRENPVPGLLLQVLPRPDGMPDGMPEGKADGGVLNVPMLSLGAGESQRLFSMSYRSAAAFASAEIRPACSFQYSTFFRSLQQAK
jgi:hypothetical protein